MRHKTVNLYGTDYEVYEDGVIYGPKGIRKLQKTRNGYLIFSVHGKGRGDVHSVSVHRLVAETFIPNPDGKPTVNHKDGDKQNNSVSNLEWATYRENAQHAQSHGYYSKAIKKLCRPVRQLDLDRNEIAVYPSIKDAAYATGISRSNIQLCSSGKSKTAGGFIWERVQ